MATNLVKFYFEALSKLVFYLVHVIPIFLQIYNISRVRVELIQYFF